MLMEPESVHVNRQLESAAAQNLIAPTTGAPILEIKNFSAGFGRKRVLHEITLSIRPKRITCVVGPSGSGKSTLLRSLNRINDETPGFHVSGQIVYHGKNIYDAGCRVQELRTRIGMLFQKPTVFPCTILENVLFGVMPSSRLPRSRQRELAARALRAAALWKEVADRLHEPATSLSIGQQQRLCLARALAVEPELILLDEPTAALDPVSMRAIELRLVDLKHDYTIVLVTHDLQQARRLADEVVFLCNGRLVESGSREKMFKHPAKRETREYLTSAYCDCN